MDVSKKSWGSASNHQGTSVDIFIGYKVLLDKRIIFVCDQINMTIKQLVDSNACELFCFKLMSWYPLGHGDKSLINEPLFAELGKKYGKSPTQIILRWHTQMGFVVIPGSKNVDHIKDNLNILDFKLTDDEMAEIAKLDKNERYYHRTDAQLVQFAGWRPEFEKN